MADGGCGDTAAFRLGLEERGLRYVVGSSTTVTVHPHDATPHIPPRSGRGPPPQPAYPEVPNVRGADGCFRFVEHKRILFGHRGEKNSCFEVERALESLPGIASRLTSARRCARKHCPAGVRG
ncbi:transposase [Streptomyces sp. ISID311]|uniref:transposase n=1 Tax=Streptomyces sp. ISID311 TaxID=2601673 RepID=UPI003211C068